jgi:CHAT domain-containing protein
VPAELDAVEARIAIATRLQTPAAGEPSGDDPDSDPTVARVLAELERHTAVHLSCHGIQDVIVPTASAFWLADGPLTVGRLMAESGDGSGKNFAVLSACSTAASSVRTPDEALNLASAMGFAGYRHVVASLWAIHDALAPSFADRVYATPASPSGLAVDRAPLAVHQAVRELRAKYPDDPFAWAPYVHVGP